MPCGEPTDEAVLINREPQIAARPARYKVRMKRFELRAWIATMRAEARVRYSGRKTSRRFAPADISVVVDTPDTCSISTMLDWTHE